MKLLDQVVWEGRNYILRSGDDKALIDESYLLLLLKNHDAELIQHFEEVPGSFRADIRFRGIRFVSHKDRQFRFIPLKDPRSPLNT